MNPIPESQQQEIQLYLSQDLDTLYSTLDLICSAEKTSLYRPGDEVSRGIAIFNKLTAFLRQKVCVEWNYCAKRNNPEIQDNVTLVAAIMDIISSKIIGFPPVLIATILIKIGLTYFCGCTSAEITNEKQSD